MPGVKISVSIPDDDVAFVDTYAERHTTSRSAAIHAAIETLRRLDVAAEYEHAFAEWETSADTALWEGVAADGVK